MESPIVGVYAKETGDKTLYKSTAFPEKDYASISELAKDHLGFWEQRLIIPVIPVKTNGRALKKDELIEYNKESTKLRLTKAGLAHILN